MATQQQMERLQKTSRMTREVEKKMDLLKQEASRLTAKISDLGPPGNNSGFLSILQRTINTPVEVKRELVESIYLLSGEFGGVENPMIIDDE